MKKKPTRYPKWFVWLRNTRDWVLARAFLGLLSGLKLLPAEKAIATTGKLARTFAFHHPRTKLARQNLRMAFPEKSPQEIDRIIRQMWDNLGRTAAEYVYLDQIFDIDIENPEKGRFELDGLENFVELRDLDGPAICFTAHTGNWEVLPVGAAAHGLNITALFRPPNNRYLANEVLKARTTAMGHLVPSKAGAAWALAEVMDNGGKVGLLADQHFKRGPKIEFFGYPIRANPLLAKLARHYDCPVYPARCIRLPNGRFRIQLQDRLDPPRDDNGRIDAQGLTQQVNKVMEGWIRENPEQWLWAHKRWRGGKAKRAGSLI